MNLKIVYIFLIYYFAPLINCEITGNSFDKSCLSGFKSDPEDCGTYYQCNFGKAIKWSCPAGLHWSNKVTSCVWATSSDCRDKKTGAIQVKESCSPGSYRSDPTNCNGFFQCSNGDWVQKYCGQGTEWNASENHCDWPSGAKCSTSTTSGDSQPSTSVVTDTTTTPGPTTTQGTQGPTTTTTTTTQGPLPPSKYKVICYYTDWSWYRPDQGKYVPSNIDYNLCTHIIYSFALLDGNDLTIKVADSWADIDNKFYEQVVAFKSKGTKVTIAIGGWNDSAGDKYSRMVNDANARKRFVQSVADFMQKYGFQGIDLDWEYPKCWQGDCNRGPASDLQNFANLCKELRAGLPQGSIISAAVSAAADKIDQGYDVPALSQSLDWIGVMAYDLHGSWDGKTGHVAPLYGATSDPLTVDYAIKHWISRGASAKKLIMGMPLYGQSFTLQNQANRGLDATTTGPGTSGQWTRQGGFLSYYEICSKKDWNVVQNQNGQMGPYAYSGNQWVSYDDAKILEIKSNYVKSKGLGGAMIWALDLDDFNNMCGQGKYPLLNKIYRTLNN